MSHIISQYFKGMGEYKTIWMQYEKMKMDGTKAYFPSMNLWPQCQCALKMCRLNPTKNFKMKRSTKTGVPVPWFQFTRVLLIMWFTYSEPCHIMLIARESLHIFGIGQLPIYIYNGLLYIVVTTSKLINSTLKYHFSKSFDLTLKSHNIFFGIQHFDKYVERLALCF